MNCKEIYENLEAFLNGEIIGFSKKQFADHIERCQICREELDSEKEIRRLFNALPTADVPEDFDRVLWSKIRQRSSRSLSLGEMLKNVPLLFQDGLQRRSMRPVYAFGTLVILGFCLLTVPGYFSKDSPFQKRGRSIVASKVNPALTKNPGSRLQQPKLINAGQLPSQQATIRPVRQAFPGYRVTRRGNGQRDILPAGFYANQNEAYHSGPVGPGQPMSGEYGGNPRILIIDPKNNIHTRLPTSNYVIDSVTPQHDIHPVNY